MKGHLSCDGLRLEDGLRDDSHLLHLSCDGLRLEDGLADALGVNGRHEGVQMGNPSRPVPVRVEIPEQRTRKEIEDSNGCKES